MPFSKKQVASILLLSDAQVDAKDSSGKTPLHWAENREVASILLQNGARVNQRDNLGGTPLHWAAHWGRQAMMSDLVLYIMRSLILLFARRTFMFKQEDNSFLDICEYGLVQGVRMGYVTDCT